ncbi:MAG: hypothetical protein KF891_18860 [Rhizobacter sp.]|nr:hypothetical protein [Rhizobacter sp.]
MYLRLRKRRKALPEESAPSAAPTPVAPGSGNVPADPSSGDWVQAESAPAGPADGPDISTSRHPNRGNARESARGSHR